MQLSVEDKILLGLFLCSSGANEVIAALKPDFNDKIELTLKEKLLMINSGFLINEIFPWQKELSIGIEHEKFCESFLIQPDLFLRLRPGKANIVKNKLRAAGIDFNEISRSAISLANASKLDDIIDLDNEAVVQDYSSQLTGECIKNEFSNFDSKISVWDCCAASGGKSIMAYDINPDIQLTVSDIRESILANLEKRFLNAGIKNYNSLLINLALKDIQHQILKSQQEIIIADVPCTGSGTWSRTPEQLHYFKEEKILEYATLQKRILSNIVPYLLPGGSLIYITCSVFKKENEEVAEYVSTNFSLRVIKQQIIMGYEKKADSMFVAILKKDL